MNKILFLIGNLNHAGGTERVTTLIANELCNEGFDISILSLSEGDNPFFQLNDNVKTYSLFQKKVSFKKKYLMTIKEIRKFVQVHQITSLVVVDSISCVFTIPALIGLNIKHICWEHFNLKVNLGSKIRTFGRWLAVKYCSEVVTLTERDLALWKESFGKIKAKIRAIPNPCITSNSESNFTFENKIVLAVGRLDYIKGFDLLIEAWSLVCKSNNDWMLHLVGGGNEETNLKTQAMNLGIDSRIVFHGAQNNVDQFYRQSSFYCLSSRNEGFPMVLLEAQTFGLPIVAFDCDTGPAEIVENGKSGFLVKPENVDDLALKLLLMMDCSKLQYKDMSETSILNSKKYSLKEIIPKWITVLN